MRRYVCLTLCALSVCLAAGLAGAAWRETTKYPPVAPEKLEPIPGMGPATLSPLTREVIRDILRYGRLHMLRGVESREGPAADDVIYKDLGVTVVSHSGYHRHSLSWNNRPKTVASMIETATRDKIRENIANTHRLGIIVLAYADYQRWFTDTHHKEWAQQRQEWKHLWGETPEDGTSFLMRDVKGLVMGPRGGLHTMGETKDERVILCLNAPFTLARAKAGIAIDVANGCDGNYFDCGGFSDRTCFCDHCRAAFKEWLEKNFTAAQRKDLFGEADAAKIDLRTLSGRSPNGGEAYGQRRRVAPLELAHARFKIDTTAWFRREIKAYGCSLNPNYLMTSTCWGHDNRPTFYNSQYEKYVGDWGDDFLFWEPGVSGGPGRGRTEEEARQEAAAKAAGKDAAIDYRWGRRSFSPSYKYLLAMARECPAVSKIAPVKGETPETQERLTELTYAECYANLCSMRSGIGGTYNRDAIRRMHRFQDQYRDYFVGSRPYAPIAVLVSLNQALAGRKDASLPFIRFMLDLGLDCQVILDDQVSEENLGRFECVVLPATDMLSEAQMTALEAYKKVGRLVVFGPAGARDEWDRDRPNGLRRLVGDLATGEAGKEALVSADGRVAFIPLGVCANFPHDMWYRRGGDCNMAELRRAFEGVLGKAWPYLAEPSQTREIHLAQIEEPARTRITAHIVNYDTTKPCEPFVLHVRLPQPVPRVQATCIQPGLPVPATVPAEVVLLHGRNYVRLNIPAITVYGVVAVDLPRPGDR